MKASDRIDVIIVWECVLGCLCKKTGKAVNSGTATRGWTSLMDGAKGWICVGKREVQDRTGRDSHI